MLKEPDSIPKILSLIDISYFSKVYKSLIDSISKIYYAGITQIDLLLAISKNNLDWNLPKLSTFNPDTIIDNYETLKYKSVIEHFIDLNLSLEAERMLTDAGERIKQDSTGLDTLSSLKSEIDSLLNKTMNKIQVEKSFSDSLIDIYSSIENEISGIDISTIKTKNFPTFNSSTNGLQKGNLIGIAGAYKSGKTTFGLNLMLDFAEQNIPIGIISLEINQRELERKILSMRTEISYNSLRNPQKLIETEKSKLRLYQENQENLKIYISDRTLTDNELKTKLQIWKDKFNIQIVMIDYLGLIKGNEKNREMLLSEISRQLKILAKELGIVIILLAQLNRQGKTNPDSTNLAESIGLVRDCDFLFITYKPLEYGYKSDKQGNQFTENHFAIKLDSSRHTQTGTQFICEVNQSGKFNEVYLNNYLNVI
jgi:replicative DNA helicase